MAPEVTLPVKMKLNLLRRTGVHCDKAAIALILFDAVDLAVIYAVLYPIVDFSCRAATARGGFGISMISHVIGAKDKRLSRYWALLVPGFTHTYLK